jgi:chemosensory pili system protein ChpA (sensor histidine kinase/response regulator)
MDPPAKNGTGNGERRPLSEWNPSEAELLRGLFLDEADKHLRHIAEAQQALARAAETTLDVDPQLVDALFRHLHTLKGAAGSVAHDAIARAAHELEELCAEMRSGKLAPTFGILERIDEGVSALRALLTSARLSAPPARGAYPPEAVALPLASADRRRQADRRAVADRRGSGDGMLRVEAERLDALLDGVGDLVILRTRLDRRVHELESVLRDLRVTRNSMRTSLVELGAGMDPTWEPSEGSQTLRPPTHDPTPLAALGLARWSAAGSEGAREAGGGRAGWDVRPEAPAGGAGGLPTRPGIPPETRVLDRLGEAEVGFANFALYLDRTARALAADAGTMRQVSEQLEEQIRRARLVPMEWMYSRLGSAMRELERTCRRPVDMVVAGGEVELDKSVVDQLSDPLLHLLRNALAHGIESPEVRAERGKPARGRIDIKTVQEGESVSITFEDDGGGIDREAVRQALRRTGRQDAADALDDKGVVAAVFEPGFSTRPHSDALAGRGMGLNIVERTIEHMGGEVKLECQAGVFTRFRLSVPLSGTITQALLFKLGGQVYAVPAAHVIEALPVGPDVLAGNAIVTPMPAKHPTGNAPALLLLRLHALLGVELPPGRRAAALHVRYGGRDFIFTCDKVIGPRTVVIRPPGPLLGLIPLYAGVTASGAGKAQLVLDLGTLADAAFGPPRTAAPGPRRGQPRILIVDDSRMARESAARLLSTGGYQTVAAEDGWDAWEILGERRFDAVVTALEMPRVDGFQLIARIRHEPTLRGLPIVVLSSRTSSATRQRALAAGANIFLPKSRHKRSLVEAVAFCLREQASTPAAGGR